MSDAFSRDEVMQAKFLELVKKHGIKSVIETGTYKGQTTEFLAAHVEKVVTIEASRTYYDECDRLDSLPNVTRMLGSSADRMAHAIQYTEAPRLYFLDAHWQAYNPLLGELFAIANSGEEPVIIIHDFLVPHCPSLGYDMYTADIPIGMDLVRPSLLAIYKNNAVISFNDDSAGGARRGALIVEPRETPAAT